MRKKNDEHINNEPSSSDFIDCLFLSSIKQPINLKQFFLSSDNIQILTFTKKKTKQTHKQIFSIHQNRHTHKHMSVVRFQRGISRMTIYTSHMTVSSISVALVPMNWIYIINSNSDDGNQFPFNRIDGKSPGQLNISSKTRKNIQRASAPADTHDQQVQTKNWISPLSSEKMSTEMTKCDIHISKECHSTEPILSNEQQQHLESIVSAKVYQNRLIVRIKLNERKWKKPYRVKKSN